jgi:hypothetical protein
MRWRTLLPAALTSVNGQPGASIMVPSAIIAATGNGTLICINFQEIHRENVRSRKRSVLPELRPLQPD